MGFLIKLLLWLSLAVNLTLMFGEANLSSPKMVWSQMTIHPSAANAEKASSKNFDNCQSQFKNMARVLNKLALSAVVGEKNSYYDPIAQLIVDAELGRVSSRVDIEALQAVNSTLTVEALEIHKQLCREG